MNLNKSLTCILICFAMTSKSQKGVIDTTVFSEFDTLSYFYKIKPGQSLSGNDATDKLKAYYALNSNHSFSEYKTKADEAGHSHQKYQHYFNKLPVYGSLLYIHSYESGDVYMANGFIASTFDSKAAVTIDATEAINLAKNQVGASKYLWEDEGMENQLKMEENDENATYYPTTELFYYPINGYKSTYTIAYKVLINSMEPFSKEYLWINATNGELLSRYSALESCHPQTAGKAVPLASPPLPSCNGDCYSGTTSTLYYGDQYVNMGKHQFGVDCKYRLLDGCNNTVIHTISTSVVSYNSNSGNSSSPVYEYTDQTNYFSFAATKPGGTAHWGAEMATEYYRNTFSREGMNGAGTGSNPFYFSVICKSNGSGNDNAYYDSSTDNLNFGSGGGGLAAQDVVCLDVVGHEYTHGVSYSEANFDPYGEPGALNESFSDIFGTMIEYYAKSNHSTGTSFSYDYGNDAFYHTTSTIPGGPTIYADRDMTYPNNSNLPDTYGGTNWWSPSSTSVDYGGRHINCTVQDYWFYLLAEGGSGTNDLGNAFCVKGIGKDKAIRIVYQTLVYYMSTNSNFSSARYGSVSAAGDLYGITSVEASEVIAAWYAVGIGANPVNSNGYYISLGNKTETSGTNYNYNTSLRFDSYIVNPSVPVNISSNNQIDVSGVHFNGPFSASYATTQFKSGSEVRLYIAPAACPNGSRMSMHEDNSGSNSESKLLNTTEQDGLHIFPNPSAGKFELHLNENLGYPSQIIVMDVFGKEVRKITNPESYLQNIEITESSSGIYMVNVYYQDKVISKKIVKN